MRSSTFTRLKKASDLLSSVVSPFAGRAKRIVDELLEEEIERLEANKQQLEDDFYEDLKRHHQEKDPR